MPVKLIKRVQNKNNLRETGVKLIKNSTPNQGAMILYKEPKKVNFGKMLREAFTWDVEVWVVRAWFDKKSSGTANALGVTEWFYGCIKEKHDNLWVSNHGIDRIINAKFLSIDEMVDVTAVPAKYETVPAENCYSGAGKVPCPKGTTMTKITPGYNKIFYNVNLRRGDVFNVGGKPENTQNRSSEAPNKTDFGTLLHIYNEHNTNDETIYVQPGDVQTFINF